MKKKTLALLLALTLCLGAGLGAFAASNSETISALLNRDIKITYNGTAQSFKDANGTVVYPISYNGTTYLPVRAVAGLVNLPVDFDATNNTVVLGSSQKQPAALTSLSHSEATKYNWIITDKAELTIAGSDANQPYTSGIQFSIWNGSASVAKERLVYCDVSGYQELSFTAWSDIDSTVKVYDQNYAVLTSFDLKAGALVSKTLSLPAGTTKVAFGADGKPGTTGNMKILNPSVK